MRKRCRDRKQEGKAARREPVLVPRRLGAHCRLQVYPAKCDQQDEKLPGNLGEPLREPRTHAW